jgi:acetyl-CoA/propionyl-CoA carboxylase biotin carboxyl carrier protein
MNRPGPRGGLFDTVLVANRGEIAVRIIATLRRLGIGSVAVYSDADARAAHVRVADEAVRIGPAPAAESYRSIPAVIAAAKRTGAQAVHPGYGFLSESGEFAQACADAGLVFIGPPPAAVAAMGDKIAAKALVAAAGVPVVPGRHEPGMDDRRIAEAVAEIGLPVMLKPSAGGGGKGMRVVRGGDDLAAAVAAARREAQSAFGDPTLLVERLIDRPRHIEVQILADEHGRVRHLGERECSLQRRHQKVVEESPSPSVSPRLRERLGAAAIETARACGYRGAGTVEFIVDSADPDRFYFLEMNTRLQVEHPVTELVTGWDLVEQQVRIAAGLPLPSGPPGVAMHGHAVEARVYAEDPAREFLPSTGRLLVVAEPEGPGVRVDSGVVAGQEVSPHYDPMIAKVMAHGADRAAALARLDRALADTAYLGVATNVGYLRRLLALAEVRAGDLHTGLIADHPELAAAPPPDDHELAAAALLRLDDLMPSRADDPWLVPDGWRVTGAAPSGLRVRAADGSVVDVEVRGLPAAATVAVSGRTAVPASLAHHGGRVRVDVAGDVRTYATAADGPVLWLSHGGRTVRLVEADRLQAESSAGEGSGAGPVRSPMPGTVIAVAVGPGDTVAAGQPLVTVEAMKMEHTLTAPADAVVAEVAAAVGGQVRLDDVLVVLAAPTQVGR